jgi:hypothetical protein
MTTRLADVSQKVDQLAAAQEQMTREITKLQAVERYVLYKKLEAPAPATRRIIPQRVRPPPTLAACDSTAQGLWKPSRVRFVHRRRGVGNFSELAAFFRCDVEFGSAVDEVVFPRSFADIPIVSSESGG